MAAARSASAASFAPRLRRRLRAYNWRPLAGLAAGCLAFSLGLIGYLFGFDSHFFGRLFSAFVVVFGVLAFTFWAAVPFVGWAADHWFGRGWAAAPGPAWRAPRQARAPARTAAPRSYS